MGNNTTNQVMAKPRTKNQGEKKKCENYESYQEIKNG